MATKTLFYCSKCDAQAPKWSGRCFECGAWGTLAKASQAIATKKTTPSASAAPADIYSLDDLAGSKLRQIRVPDFPAVTMLPAGLTLGSVTLLSGEPGAGKSTLSLQLASNFSQRHKVIYFSAEEAATQVKDRGQRLGTFGKDFFLSEASTVESIVATVAKEEPVIIFVDSIQTISSDEIETEMGSITMVRAVTAKLLTLAKEQAVAVVIIGHVTKEGAIAGPKSMEHMVDAVFMLEGDKTSKYRLLGSRKNRFGSTDTVLVMQLTAKGFKEITDAATIFVKGFTPKSGSSLTAAVVGDQIFFLEVQALVTKTSFGYAKRTASGFLQKRLEVILAIMKKKLDYDLDGYDVYINIAGGFQVNEPAMDLAVALSIISSLHDKALPDKSIAFGELGLAAELRPVRDTSLRLKEIQINKFTTVYLPPLGKKINSPLKLKTFESLDQVVKDLKW